MFSCWHNFKTDSPIYVYEGHSDTFGSVVVIPNYYEDKLQIANTNKAILYSATIETLSVFLEHQQFKKPKVHTIFFLCFETDNLFLLLY